MSRSGFPTAGSLLEVRLRPRGRRGHPLTADAEPSSPLSEPVEDTK